METGCRISVRDRLVWVSNNITAVDWDIWSTFGRRIALYLQKRETWPYPKTDVSLRRYNRHLGKLIWRQNSIADLIRIKFVISVQNHIPMTIRSSKSKPGVEFPYVVCLFSKSRSSGISAMDWDWKPANMNVKNCRFLTTCKAHRWVTHTQQQKLILSHHRPWM